MFRGELIKFIEVHSTHLSVSKPCRAQQNYNQEGHKLKTSTIIITNIIYNYL